MERAASRVGAGAARLVALGLLGTAGALLSACGFVVGIDDIGVTTGAGGGAGGSGGAGGGDGGPPPQGLGCDDAIPLVFDDWGTREIDAATAGAGTSKSGPFNDCVGSDGPEHVYVFDAEKDGVLTASLPATATSFDTVLYARKTSCSNPDEIVLCHDQVPGTLGGELISFPVVAGERYYLFVDGRSPVDFGAYHLTVSFFAGDDCDSPVPIVLGTAVGSKATLLGMNQSGSDNDAKCGLCATNPCAGAGRQTIYSVRAPLGKEIEVRIAAVFDAVLYARVDCANGATQLEQNGCIDETGKGEEIIHLPGGVMPTILFVDTAANSPAGPFMLSLTVK